MVEKDLGAGKGSPSLGRHTGLLRFRPGPSAVSQAEVSFSELTGEVKYLLNIRVWQKR